MTTVTFTGTTLTGAAVNEGHNVSVTVANKAAADVLKPILDAAVASSLTGTVDLKIGGWYLLGVKLVRYTSQGNIFDPAAQVRFQLNFA